MAPGFKSTCAKCSVETQISKCINGFFLCSSCSQLEIAKRKSPKEQMGNSSKGKGTAPTRKSLRFLGKPRVVYSSRANTNEDKNRKSRHHLKTLIKAPYAYSLPLTSDHIFFRGIYYQIGDIVGLKDTKDGKMYYAQIRGFLQDQYCEKSAIITWLLPSASSPEEGFDPATYFLGPEEDIPRKLEYMEFICHAPSDYYRNPYSPYPTLSLKPETGFIWTRLDSGVTYKIDECKKICDEVRFVRSGRNGEEVDSSDDDDSNYNQKAEEIVIADDYKRPVFV